MDNRREDIFEFYGDEEMEGGGGMVSWQEIQDCRFGGRQVWVGYS